MTRLRSLTGSRRLLAAVIALLVVVAGISLAVVSSSSGSVHTQNQFIPGTPEGKTTVDLDTTLYLPAAHPGAGDPAGPWLRRHQGVGGRRGSLVRPAWLRRAHLHRPRIRTLRRADPLRRPAVRGARRVAARHLPRAAAQRRRAGRTSRRSGWPAARTAAGSRCCSPSRTPRVQAVAADITWNNLTEALFPNDAGTQPGVFKKLWAGLLFSAGLPPISVTPCGRYALNVCAAYQASVRLGHAHTGAAGDHEGRQPGHCHRQDQGSDAAHPGRAGLAVPAEPGRRQRARHRGQRHAGEGALALRRARHRHRHERGDQRRAELVRRGVRAARCTPTAAFDLAEQGSVVSASTGRVTAETLRVRRLPRHRRSGADADRHRCAGPAAVDQRAGRRGPGCRQLRSRALGRSARLRAASASCPPRWQTAIVRLRLAELVGADRRHARPWRSPSRPRRAGDGTLFVALRDLSPDGTETLPAQLVAPIIVPGLKANKPKTITVQLPSIVHTVPSGHRLALTVSTTDFAYALPPVAREYEV